MVFYTHARRFTLIEMLVVISIISVIAAMLLPALSRVRARAAHTRWQAYSVDIRKDPDLDAYYAFEEDPSDPTQLRNLAAGDPSDSGYIADTRDGVLQGDAVWLNGGGRFPGKQTLSLDGSGDYVALKHFYSIGEVSSISVAAWVKSTNPTSQQFIISYDRSDRWRLAWVDDNSGPGMAGKLAFDTADDTHGIDDFGLDNPVNDSKWHHVVGIYDADADRKYLYLDGELFHQADSDHDGEPLGTGRSQSYGFIGTGSEARNFNDAPGPPRWFEGQIDEIAVFHRALSAAEVEDMFRSGQPASSQQ